jgi:hypothetical protein
MINLLLTGYFSIAVSILALNLSLMTSHKEAKEKYRSTDLARANRLIIAKCKKEAALSPIWPILILINCYKLLK